MLKFLKSLFNGPELQAEVDVLRQKLLLEQTEHARTRSSLNRWKTYTPYEALRGAGFRPDEADGLLKNRRPTVTHNARQDDGSLLTTVLILDAMSDARDCEVTRQPDSPSCDTSSSSYDSSSSDSSSCDSSSSSSSSD